ncbi:choice-of-anchor J domain-containing protein [uncultured Pontibacter sp.]|uniref:T9SS-dependent choice-of-anchor J family protein n=1 Tax=uncultured Pontibacter sp. TaxID=453356 RepID=UPI00261FDA8D|nr:choice-of-anchor J domain-containing protein [uncultured Pontibacter sp.]
MVKHLQKLSALVLVCCAFLGSSSEARGQVLLNEGTNYSQNFNTLATTGTANVWTNNTTIAGWYSTRENYQASPGSSNAGALYSFGNSADRALGAIQSNSTGAVAYGVQFKNTSGGKISSVKVKYTGEQWRNGGNTSPQLLEFSYEVTTSASTEITNTLDNFTRVSELDFTSPITGASAAALDGNASANRKAIEHTFNVNIEDGQFIVIKWIDANDSGSDHGLSVDDFEFSPVYDSQITTPTIRTDANSLDLGENVANTTFLGSYKLSAVNIAEGEEVTVTAAAPFEISTSELEGFRSTYTFTGADLETERTIYVRAKLTAIGQVNGNITHTAAGATDLVVNVKATVVSPYTQNFDNCGTTLPGGWTTDNALGDEVWECTTYGRTGNAVQINGYNGSVKDNVDALISPALDLTGFNVPLLTFWTRTAFNGPGLTLFISANYNGTDVDAATWDEVDVTLPGVASDVWTKSELLLDKYKGETVHIAFVYSSGNGAEAARWTLDDFSVTDEPFKFVADNATFDFGALEPGNYSEAEYVKFKALGFTEEIVIASDLIDFEVSKDNKTFAQSVTYTAEEAAEGAELFVRFLPKSVAPRFEGKLTAISGNGFTMELGTLTGSSLLKDATLDIVTWNMEWFGADKDEKGNELGPANEELQYTNAKKVFADLDADILALQEVSNDADIQRLAGELGYEYVASSAYSYSWDTSRDLVPQKLYFLYKPEVAQVKKQKVLLSKFYEDARKGVYDEAFTGYPEGAAKFWASGRLPFMVEFETTVNNVKKSISLVNLHTRANSGTDVSKHTQRKFDVQVLKDSLDAYYSNKHVVILGDYNDDVDVSVVNNLPSTFAPFVEDADYNALTLELSKTGAFTYASGQYESFLDHIIVSSSLSNDYIAETITIEDQFLNSIGNFRNTTSDHMPVSARFNLSATSLVTFTEATATKAEDAGKYTVSLTLSEAQATEQTVTVSVVDGGTASAADYTVTGATNGVVTVIIPANATTATFELAIVDDELVEETEAVTFQITNNSANLVIGEAKTYTLTITDNDMVTGIADATKGQFRVYPNPATSHVNLVLPEKAAKGNVNLSVWALDGRKVFETAGNMDAANQNLNSKVSNLAKGVYIIKVQAGKEVYQTRLMKN